MKAQKRTVAADSWKTRRFDFNKDTRTLRYFERAPEGQLKGEVTVRGVDARQDLQGGTLCGARHKPHRFDFILDDDTGERTVLAVSAADAPTRQRWMNSAGTEAQESMDATADTDHVHTSAASASSSAVLLARANRR